MSRIGESTKEQIKLAQQEKSNSTKYNTMIEVFFQAINANTDDTYSQDEIDDLLQKVIAAVEGGNIAKGTYALLSEATTDLDPAGNFPDSNKWTVNIDGTGADAAGIYKWFQSDSEIAGSWVFSSQFIGLATATQDGLLSSALYNIIKDYPLYSEIDGRITTNKDAITAIVGRLDVNEAELIRLANLIADNAKQITANTTNIGKNGDAIVVNEKQIALNKSAHEENLRKIGNLETGKQNTDLTYKQGTTVEQQIEANEKENIDSKAREDNFLKLDGDGAMGAGYDPLLPKSLIPKDKYDTMVAQKDGEIAALNAALATKADVTDLGQKPLIYIPGQGADPLVNAIPIVPVVGTIVDDNGDNQTGLIYTFNAADWAAWKTRVDPTGTLLINGIVAEIGIKDATSTTYAGQESYNNGSATKQPFGTDVDAQWNLSDGNLNIITNNQNRSLDRTVRQITFLVESTAGSGVDQKARDDIATLNGSKQNRAISPILGMNALTVEAALAELKNAKDALEDKTTELSFESGTGTKITTDLHVGRDIWVEGTVHVGGKEPEHEVALKGDVIPVLIFDENDTIVSDTRYDIRQLLNDKEGRTLVNIDHKSGTQAEETYSGYVQIIENDTIEGTTAYFAESSFTKFTTADDGQPYQWQLFLNVIGWKAWQKTLDATDPRRDGRDDAEIDTFTQIKLDALPLFQARRDWPLMVANENILTDSVEQSSIDTLQALVDGGIDSNVIPQPADEAEDDDFLENEIARFGDDDDE